MESNLIEKLWKVRHPYDALFLSLINGYDKVAIFSPKILFLKDDEILFEYLETQDYITVNYNRIFNIYQTEYNLEEMETANLLKLLFNTHLNLEVKFILWTTIININEYRERYIDYI